MQDLMSIQADLEARMASLGIERFRRNALEARQDGQATRSRSMSTVLNTVIDPTASAILKFRHEAGSGKAGRRHSAVRFFAGIEAETLAYIATKLVLDGYAQDQNLTRLCVRIGQTVELEKRLAKFAEENAANLRGTLKFLDGKTSHGEHRRRVLMHMLHEHGDAWDPWSDRDRLLVGLKLVELLIQSTGMFEVGRTRSGKKTVAWLRTTRRFRDWLATLDMQFEIMAPELLPCVVPPKDWTGLTGGGYHTDAFAYPLQLVKTRHKAHKEALRGADLSAVMSAVNAIQRTPWAIERRTLEVAKVCLQSAAGMAGLAPMEHELLPSKPPDIDTNEDAKRRWKREAAAIHDRNHSDGSRRVMAVKTIALAEEFAQYDAIYFPYQLDFRGRVYAVPQVLNPQGSDLAKGLLVFAEGDPIDSPEALDWFLTHGANSFGVDKVDFSERHAWVMANQEGILAAAAAPLDNLWWTEADSPFVFLTWCFEYADWVADPAHPVRVPVGMDGSCNGLQHYSAMLLDPIAGKAVNLIPSDKPQDIYAEVAKVVTDELEKRVTDPFLGVYLSDEDYALAKRWQAFGINRSITKRPVMVLPYGGTLSSCQKYVLEAATKRIAEGQPNPFGDELFSACNWLGARVWSAIGEVVVSARLAMGWLQGVTRTVAAEGAALKWTTPSGFVVVQAYPEVTTRQIDTTLLGSRYAPKLTEETPETLDRRRQVNGVAPNFVHSMDAAALVLTVNQAAAAGVTKFAMIHDSYGTTAAKSPTLATHLREQFVSMYSGKNVLQQFADDVVPEHLVGVIPSHPMVGGLDLTTTLRSSYFFA